MDSIRKSLNTFFRKNASNQQLENDYQNKELISEALFVFAARENNVKGN